MGEIKTFRFGDNYYPKIIKTETIDEAINEFILACIDFSEFSLKHDSLSKTILDEPFGFTNGIKNVHYYEHRFYEKIPIYCNDVFEKYLTLTEFNNWHLRQVNILEDKSEKKESTSQEIATSYGIKQMQRYIINSSLNVRKIKQKLALERKYDKNSIAKTMQETKNQLKIAQKEYEALEKKMNIIRTYTGIGRDIVKICSGNPSQKLKVDIFQSYRYMKEDIEILTDFEDFDAHTLCEFDEFVKNHYKELLPSNKCIQAFKVTNQQIKYENIYTQQEMDKANKMVYLLIRDGDNVYRIFNDYKLHEKHLFTMDNPKEAINDIILQLIQKDLWTYEDESKEILESLKAKIMNEQTRGYVKHFSNEGYKSVLPLDLNEEFLSNLEKTSNEEYLEEIKRRKNYIIKYSLENELNIYSWRWGKSLGQIKIDCFGELNNFKWNMYVTKAYKENDYLTLFAILKQTINYYNYLKMDADEKMVDFKPLEDGRAIVDYNPQRDSNIKNDFSDDFDAITAEPLVCYSLWYDFEKYMEFKKEEKREILEQHLENENFCNFHSMAVLQNILDSKIAFKDLDQIDLIFFEGVEQLNFIKDSANLLSSKDSLPNVFLDKEDLKKGDKVYIIRNYGSAVIIGRERYSKDFKENVEFKTPQVILAEVLSATKKEVKIKGYFDVYVNSNWDKRIKQGDAKISTISLSNSYQIVSKNVNINEILILLKNRFMREKRFQTSLGLKEVLKLIRTGEEYNFSGGRK